MAVSLNKSRAGELFNLTPMIDVVFQLLIFFMVVTRFSEEDRQMDVELPAASEAMPLTAKPKEMFVNIDNTGRFFIEGKFLSLAETEQALRRAASNNPVGQTVIIRADKRVPLDPVVAVMNACNKAGIRDYMLTTQGGE